MNFETNWKFVIDNDGEIYCKLNKYSYDVHPEIDHLNDIYLPSKSLLTILRVSRDRERQNDIALEKIYISQSKTSEVNRNWLRILWQHGLKLTCRLGKINHQFEAQNDSLVSSWVQLICEKELQQIYLQIAITLNGISLYAYSMDGRRPTVSHKLNFIDS